MDSNPQLVKPISDDQELAKVLAGVSGPTDEALQFETTPIVTPTTPPASDPVTPPADEPADTPEPVLAEAPVAETEEAPLVGYNPPITPPAVTPPSLPSTPSTDLTSIKNDALNDLRPLVDKLDIAPDEKFDTYLLLIRSTDDKSLIAPAYAAAQAITDEARKAQALLDVIKEIDYLSNPPQ